MKQSPIKYTLKLTGPQLDRLFTVLAYRENNLTQEQGRAMTCPQCGYKPKLGRPKSVRLDKYFDYSDEASKEIL